jgi:uncharacterized membrane protein YoaK (UPF0700 family)
MYLALYFGNSNVILRDLEFRFHVEEAQLVLQLLVRKIPGYEWETLTEGVLYFLVIVIFMDWAIRGLFRPSEEYTDPAILTVSVPCFVLFLSCILEFSSESVCLP